MINVKLKDGSSREIREARNERVPYIIIVGEKEEQDGTIALRSRSRDEGSVELNTFINRILDEISTKSL